MFYHDLCEAFLAANIPLRKLKNLTLKACLEKYTPKHVPVESILRKHYVPSLYDELIQKVRACITDH